MCVQVLFEPALKRPSLEEQDVRGISYEYSNTSFFNTIVGIEVINCVNET